MITCIVGKKKIDTFSYKSEQLREWSNRGMLKCPVCNKKVIYNNGEFKIPHFKHEKNCDCYDLFSEGTTEEHIEGIRLLHRWLQEQEGVCNIELEKWISETKQKPDIYFEYNDKSYVIEFQCSPISTNFLKRRELYRLNNIVDIWILGSDKYDIGFHRTLKQLDVKDMTLNRRKVKTIEKELFEFENRIYYLIQDKIAMVTRFYNHKEKNKIFKTIFDLSIDSKKLEECSIGNLVSKNDLYLSHEVSEIDRKIEEIERFFEDIDNKYEVLIDTLNIAHYIKKEENSFLLKIKFDNKLMLSRDISEVNLRDIEKNIYESEYNKNNKLLYLLLELYDECKRLNNNFSVVDGYCYFNILSNSLRNGVITVEFYNDYDDLEFNIEKDKVTLFKVTHKGKGYFKYTNTQVIEMIKYNNISSSKIIGFIEKCSSDYLREMKYGGYAYEKTTTI